MSKTLSQLKRKNGVGGIAMNVLRLASDVVNGQQIVIGGDTYEIDIISTDSEKLLTQQIESTGTEFLLTMEAHGKVVGNLLQVDTEMFRVKKVHSVDIIEVSRGACGTTKATHTIGTSIYESDADPAAPIIAIGLGATLTPTAAAPAIVAVINSNNTQGVVADSVSVNEIVIRTVTGTQPKLLACTETLAGANNGWSAAAMYGTISTEIVGMRMATRAATAVEVAVDHMLFNFPFTVGSALVFLTSSAGVRNLVWNGAVTTSGGRVTVTNGGATDWIAGDLITVLASE